jgi:hypothetical protein
LGDGNKWVAVTLAQRAPMKIDVAEECVDVLDKLMLDLDRPAEP